MIFLYVELQKSTRDERRWVIRMSEAGFNINYVAFHFDIHKTLAYWIINRFAQTKLAGDRPRSDRQKKILTPQEERFIQITSRQVPFLTANPLCITSRNFCGTRVSTKIVRNHLQCMWRMLKILTFCPFEKRFMKGTALHTNEILKDLIFDKIVIAFTAKNLINFVLISKWSFVIRCAYLWCVAKLFCFSIYPSMYSHKGNQKLEIK